MKVEFNGTLAEIKSEIAELFGEEPAAPSAGKSKTAGKGAAAKALAPATLDDIREAMLACTDKEGKKTLLADYGVSKLSEIDEDKYEAFLAEVKKLS